MQSPSKTNSNSSPVKLFIAGATGYVGGAFLTRLLHPSQTGKWDITVLTRNESTLAKFRELGVTPILGTLDDYEILKKESAEADVVMNTADCDHLNSTKAIVEGLSVPREGKRRILIHTSGTALIGDDARGEYAADKIYNDLDVESINKLPIHQPHRIVDKHILDNNHAFESIIICPPTIYGIGSGPFNRHSVQIPRLIKLYLKIGYAATIGKGLNIWSNVHIEDLADLYLIILEKSLKNEMSTGYDGWYFSESGEHVLKNLVAKIGEELYKRGAIKQEEPLNFTTEEVDQYYGDFGWTAYGSNSRCTSDRARQLGWKVDGSRGTVFDNIGPEVEAIISAQKLEK